MPCTTYTQDWPGRDAWGREGHHGHRSGPPGWMFTKGRGGHGRPSPEEIEQLMAMRQMRGGPFGGGPRGRGRARRGDVRLALLRLLAEEPRNGYQLMQTIEERSAGHWRPSPGSVYPTLAQLEDEGLVRATEAPGGRHFEITDSGREHLESRAGEPAPWEQDDQPGAGALTELGPLIMQIGKAAWQVAQVGNEAQTKQASEVLTEARRALYRILAQDDEATS
ncbi:MAG: PadR family transcriptional regulator [Solirubrobacteraceae bacterium]